MGLKNGEMHAVSLVGTIVLAASLGIPLVFVTEAGSAEKADMRDMEAIEASIAYKKTPVKQPQKQHKNVEVEKPKGVSRNDTKKPIDGCKTDADCKQDGETCDPKTSRCVDKSAKKQPKPDDKDPFKNFKHTSDDDNEAGKPTTAPGDFNGSEFGWAPQTKGHPFWQKFAQDIHDNFAIPTISDVKGAPVGCFHITADGKIADTKFKEKSGNDVLDDAAQRALDAVKKVRDDKPEPVPTELLGATTRWICFRFDPNKV